MNLINLINSEIDARGWSRKRLAAESGLAQSTLSQKLSQPKLTTDEIERIAHALGMSASELFARAEERASSTKGGEK